MAEFSENQKELLAARNERVEADKAVFRLSERVKKINREKQKVLRTHGADSGAFKELSAREQQQVRALAEERTRLDQALDLEGRVLDAFVPFTDPREQVGHLADDTPMLMFPLRMETRFKRVASREGARHELWVRVFPDECSIDTFDELLTESEVKKARRYLIDKWKAGVAADEDDAELNAFIDNKRRGAWRDLMGMFRGGRASWVEQNYRPVNADAIPVRHHTSDIILVIPSEALPEDAVQAALNNYWSAFLSANGDAEAIATAFDTLVGALGGGDAARERAGELIEAYKPDNIDKIAVDPEDLPDIIVAFLLFPQNEDFDSKLAAWSQAARVTTLPERLVLLGFREGRAEPIIEQIGNIIPDPLIVGPDPGEDINDTLKRAYGEEFETFSDDVKAEKYVEYLSTQSATKWLFDFDEAIEKGMGFKVNIDTDTYENGISRLFVLGVKLSADAQEAGTLLEQLVRNHHLGDSGFAVLPQGAATNNTENSPSAYTVTEDPDEAYERYLGEYEFDDPVDSDNKLDGRWLAELLGIDPEGSTLKKVSGYTQTDQCDARAMNAALWNATIGYFMESMLTPVFNDTQREMTRWFLINWVSGRGGVPAIRIGDQPYGILPVSKVSDLAWLSDKRTPFRRRFAPYWGFLQDAYSVIQTVKQDWNGMLDRVAYVGKEGDSQQILLQALGLHANSVEFDQRYAESFEHLFNRLNAEGQAEGLIALYIALTYNPQGMALLEKLGYVHDPESNPEIPILSKYFLTKENNVSKDLIDDQELSEEEGIRIYTEAGGNYIEWLIENARHNHRNIRDQKGFIDNQPPYALLYDMLRHSLNLSFADTGLKLYENAEVLSHEQVTKARIDAPFIGIQEQPAGLQSKWDLIYRPDPRITETDVQINEHISGLIRAEIVNSQTRHLQELIAALEKLKFKPTAKLERAFVEHLDLCTYRLDAWLLGLVNFQLNAMRFGGEADESEPASGIYLGAFGWLEDLKPEEKVLSEAPIPEDLPDDFLSGEGGTPMTDSTNAGYVHAPSIDHALTAAVLRNAYISNAEEEEAEVYKVGLSAERVRLAMSIIQGMQQGQSLAALLGYQLERGLHDNNGEILDSYIYELRKVFPLNANKLKKTAIKAGRVPISLTEQKRFAEEEEEFEVEKAVTKIDANNVVNGLALLEHIDRTGNENYPFGFPEGTGVGKLMSASSPVSDAINREVKRLRNIRDAVADLGISEGVHQVVQGNYERGSAALDSYSKGAYPQLPEVVKSHNAGIGLTHRFGIHLPCGETPAASANPRVKMEPAINAWLDDLFPALEDIVCHYEFKLPDYDAVINSPVGGSVALSELGFAPIDILYMLNVESDKSLTALDDYVLRHIYATHTPRPDAEIRIHYTRHVDGEVGLFELSPLVDSLRKLILKSRPLKATDMALQTEAAEGEAPEIVSGIDTTRIEQVNSDVSSLSASLKSDVVDILSPLVDLEEFTNTLGNAGDILDAIDTVMNAYITHLAGISHFGLPEAGFAYVYDRKAAIYRGIYEKVLHHRQRWEEKNTKYDDLMTHQLPAAGSDEEAIAILQEAERTISTANTIPVPSIPDYQTQLAVLKGDFDTKMAQMQAFLDDNIQSLKDLVTAADALNVDLHRFDFQRIDIDAEKTQVLVLAEDICKHAIALNERIIALNANVTDLVTQAGSKADANVGNRLLRDAVKGIFGEDFVVVPEFTLSPEQRTELQQCFDNREQLLDYQKNTLGNDFPVDDWLYGVARVREQPAAWESLVMLAEGLKTRSAIDLTALQLPYVEDDPWLGLSYPQEHVVDSDRLLYTAYMPGFDPGEAQCGLMVDEWTEIVPHRQETTGLCFHYDRPNSEPPQSLLLMTPSVFTGSWRWQDLVDTLHDTLDLARIRAVEPDHVDHSPYAKFLPATVAAVTTHPVTIAMNYLLQANVTLNTGGD